MAGVASLAKLMPSGTDSPPNEPPPELVLDCIHLVFNNVAVANVEAKVNDIAPLLRPEHFGWFANYFVMKRISTQAWHGSHDPRALQSAVMKMSTQSRSTAQRRDDLGA